MAENTAIHETHDDDLVDEALDERHGGKLCSTTSAGQILRLSGR